jgi:hypothetical protein
VLARAPVESSLPDVQEFARSVTNSPVHEHPAWNERRTMKQAPQWIPPWAERAVGAAAAAVFLAGIVSAGLVDSSDGTDAPDVAAPGGPLPSTAAAEPITQPVSQITSLAAPLSVRRGERSAGSVRGASSTLAPVVTPPSSPSTDPSTPTPPTDAPGPELAQTDPAAPSVGVAVGPIAVGASTAGVGASVGDTSIGDTSAAPQSNGGVTVTIDTGAAAPIVLTLP